MFTNTTSLEKLMSRSTYWYLFHNIFSSTTKSVDDIWCFYHIPPSVTATKSSTVTDLCSCSQNPMFSSKLKTTKTRPHETLMNQWIERGVDRNCTILTASAMLNQWKDRKIVSSFEGRVSWFQYVISSNLAFASQHGFSSSSLQAFLFPLAFLLLACPSTKPEGDDKQQHINMPIANE